MKSGFISRNIVFIVVLLIYINVLFLPSFVARKINLKEGDIAFGDIIAPFNFSIPKSKDELAKERKDIESKVPKVFYFDLKKIDSVRSKLNSFIKLVESLRLSKMSLGRKIDTIQTMIPISQNAITIILSHSRGRVFKRTIELVDKIMVQGYLKKTEISDRIVYIQIGDRELPEAIDNFFNDAKINKILEKESRSTKEIVWNMIEPNVILNEERSNELLDEAMAQLRTTKGVVKKGEMIVGAHERVSYEALEKIEALNKIYSRFGLKSIINFFLGRNLFFLMIILLMKYYFDIRKKLIKGKNILLFLGVIIITYFGFVKLITSTVNNVYAIPIAFTVLFSYLFLDLETSLILSVLFSLATAVIIPELKLLVFLIVSGISATLIARMIQHRIEFYLNALIMVVVNVTVIILSHVSLQASKSIVIDVSWGAVNGFISSFIVLLLLPAFERIFSFTTDLTLLEFANLNRAIFKKLALEAPGTYHHSIVSGNLAEAGAVAVGANPILARVGAYYHDIGKLKKPEYFSENQMGMKNPHDQLTPEMSKLVIVSHVKEGIEMAKKIGLPSKVVELIAEHHGTTVVEPFYLKALQTRGKPSIDDFRYPGPIPSSLEAAVIMLADSVEAAARSADNITVSKLKKIIKEIFDKKFNDHQLDDCELTRKGLLQLQKAFFPILAGVFHPRVDYDDKDIRSRSQQK